MLRRLLPFSRLWRLLKLHLMPFRDMDLRCPVCERFFRSKEIVSTYSFGGKRTDFHAGRAGTRPLACQIHTCSRCGYSGLQRDFAGRVELSPVLKARVRAELGQVMERGSVTASEKYEAAAKVAAWRGTDARHVAELLLRAAWCCVDERDTEAERYFRRLAAWKFEDALESCDCVGREERAVLTYLVGEVWRRVGDTKVAAVWFDRVASEVVDARAQQWVIDAAHQQRDCPQEWFR